MKLRDEYLLYLRDEEAILVPVGKQSFNGFVRANKTTAAILDCLKENTSEKTIVRKLLEKYDASEEQIAEDVKAVLCELKQIGAIED